MSYPFNINASRCRLTGLSGATLSAGTTLTRASDGVDALRAIVMENGLFKVTYEASVSVDQPQVHFPYTAAPDGSWVACGEAVYGDGFFCVVPYTTVYDEVEIIEANQDAIEIAWRYNAKALNVPYLNSIGITHRDQYLGVDYTGGGAIKFFTECNVTKVTRMQRGVRGYWMAMNTEPRIAPPLWTLDAVGATANNESDYGEREIWTGDGAAAVWSSNPLAGMARFPAWGQRAVWATAASEIGQSINNYLWWAGIDDATGGIYAHASYKQTQNNPDGFPRTQTTGPWYIADVSALTNVARAMVQQMPLETCTSAFAPSQRGKCSSHYVHSWPAPDGRPMRFPLFYWSKYYVADSSSGYANEPSASLQAEVAAMAAGVEWPR